MKNVTTLHPAKRIVVLYALSLLLVIILLILGLAHLQQQLGQDDYSVAIVWKVVLPVGLAALFYSFLWRLTSIYKISDEYVSATFGILSKTHIRIPLNRIVDYQVITPLLERILGLGSIHIDTAGDEDLIMRQVSQGEITSAVSRLNKLLNKELQSSKSPVGFVPAT